MKTPCSIQTAILLMTGMLVLITCVSASGEITAHIGDTVPLSGYSYGSSSVYLFLTGPNLPVNGVALSDITARADEGHFTEVSVDSNDQWEYSWSTTAMSGRLDAGSYTVWVVNRPLDRSQLGKADYSTVSIRLGIPAIKVNSPIIPGTLVLNTSPSDASVLIDDVFRGRTPLIIERIDPGPYRVTFKRSGFAKLSTPVWVDSAKITEVSGELMQLTGSLNITTIPPGTNIFLDTIAGGVTPLSIPDISVGNHTLTFEKEGYVTAERIVMVREDRTTEINISLLPASPPVPDRLRAAVFAPVNLIAVFITILLGTRYLQRKM